MTSSEAAADASVLDTSGDFQIGRVISRTFAVVGRNPATVAALAAAAMMPMLAAKLLVPFGLLAARTANPIVLILESLGTYVLQVSLVRMVIVDLNGERPGFLACLNTAPKHFWPVLGIGIVRGVGVVLAAILLVIPGVILALRWSMAVPVQVVEDTDVSGALERSVKLTEGSRWKIFGLYLMWMVLLFLLVAPPALLAAAGSLPETGFGYAGLDWLRACVTEIVGAAGAACVYYELRVVKEGLGVEQLAAAFD